MWYCALMRYYQPFPAAIPLYEAGYPRVTHPSATNSEKQALHRPFDLHVLSTPPAFILSQDQTLMFKSWFFQNLAWLNFRIQSRRTVTVFGCVFFWKRCDSAFESRSLNYSLTNLSRLFHCSVFNVLLFVVLSDNFYILSQVFLIVKNFFWNNFHFLFIH